MKKKIDILNLLVSILLAIISSLLTTLLTSYLSKDNEIETRLFNLKIEAYQDIHKNISNLFDSKKFKEDYLSEFKKIITNSGFLYEYNGCATKLASKCLFGDKNELKHLQATSLTNILNDRLYLVNKELWNRAQILPANVNKLILENLKTNIKEIRLDLDNCLRNEDIDCNIDFDDIDWVITELSISLQDDIQKHYK